MNRFITGATVALTAAALSFAAQARDLSLAYFMGPKHPMNAAVFSPFAEKLAELSGGELTVTQFAGGALNSAPPKQYSILLDGVSDIAFHLPGYTQPLFPVTTALSTPGMCQGAEACTEALWNAYEAIEKEYDAKILALWANEPQAWFSRDKPIKKLEDVSGLVVRVTSAQDIPFVGALGASAVSQPVSVINQNLSNGVIDVIAIGSSAAMSFKLFEPAKYMTTNVPGSAAPFVLLMNKGVYNSLSDQERAWVDEASGKELSLQGARAFAKAGAKGIDISAKNDTEHTVLDDAEKARWADAMKPALDAWLTSEVGQGMTGQEIMNMMQGK